jgi:hypothetical protein
MVGDLPMPYRIELLYPAREIVMENQCGQPK